MSKMITFRLAAWTEAAGKYNPEAPREGNEDNWYVDDDLQDDILNRINVDEEVKMSDCGCLLVVADGMGGMNAGEVASDIAIQTVKEYFGPSPENKKRIQEYAPQANKRKEYLERLIKEADREIKNYANEHAECRGMGSTIILVWIVGNEMTVSWCGDSRAYRYNPNQGLTMLSKDHSLVQELVDRGVLTYEETFDHPQGNIVTRSLGDPSSPARPETKQYEIYNDDIILVCSDGLSGVLRDRETLDEEGNLLPGQNIESIIEANRGSMSKCREALFKAAEEANWYDNVTVLLCQIMGGTEVAPKQKREKAQLRPIPDPTGPITRPEPQEDPDENPFKKYYLIGGILLLLILAVIGGSLLFTKGEPTKEEIAEAIANGDTVIFDESEGITRIVTKVEKAEIEKKNKEIQNKKKTDKNNKGNKDDENDKKVEDPNKKVDEDSTESTESDVAIKDQNIIQNGELNQVNGSNSILKQSGEDSNSSSNEKGTKKLTDSEKKQIKVLEDAIKSFPQYRVKLDNLIKLITNPESAGTVKVEDIVQSWKYRTIALDNLKKLKTDAEKYNLMGQYNDISTKINAENYTLKNHKENINPAIQNLKTEINNAKEEALKNAEKAEKIIEDKGGSSKDIEEIPTKQPEKDQ